MILIADSSALVTLSICNSLYLLEEIFGEVRVPEAVYREVIYSEKPESEELEKYLKGKVVKTTNDQPEDLKNLGDGETEAILLYEFLHADWFLVDDERAKKKAKSRNLNVIGSIGVLIIAKEKSYIKKIKPYLEKIKNSNIYLSNDLITRVLKITGES